MEKWGQGKMIVIGMILTKYMCRQGQWKSKDKGVVSNRHRSVSNAFPNPQHQAKHQNSGYSPPNRGVHPMTLGDCHASLKMIIQEYPTQIIEKMSQDAWPQRLTLVGKKP